MLVYHGLAVQHQQTQESGLQARQQQESNLGAIQPLLECILPETDLEAV
jgi:hypothetical protein